MQSATLYILRHAIQKKKEKLRRRAKLNLLLNINPQKFLNPYQVYIILDDFIIIEELMKSPKDSCDDNLMVHTAINKYKQLLYAKQQPKDQTVSFFVQNRPNQQRVCWKYITERFLSFGKQNFRDMADIINEVHDSIFPEDRSFNSPGNSSTRMGDCEEGQQQRISQKSIGTETEASDPCCFHTSCRLSTSINTNIDTELVQEEFSELVNKFYKNTPFCAYELKRSPDNPASSQIGSIHFSRQLTELLKYDYEEFCIETQKFGLKEIFGQSYYQTNVTRIFTLIRNTLKAIKANDFELLQKLQQSYFCDEEFLTKNGEKFVANVKVSRYERGQRYYLFMELGDVQNYPEPDKTSSRPFNYELTNQEYQYLNRYKNDYQLKEIQKTGKVCGYKQVDYVK